MEIFLAALALGFLGSFHCVGMCGPIALALPAVNNTKVSRVLGILFYNSGRVITYGIFGVLFGFLGKAFIISGYQQVLSVALGVLILLIVFFSTEASQKFSVTQLILPFVTRIKISLQKLFKTKSYESLFLIGFLNGFLPCGLVYTAVAGAIVTGEPLKGSLFMIFFGVGTVPAMMLVSLAGQVIKMEWRNRIRKAVPVFVSLMAIILILRGLNLGIPYISPQLSKTDCTKHSCCHKK